MKCLGCALRSPKRKTGNHKEQRDAHAGGRVQNIGDIPVNRADTVRVRDIPGRCVDHHHHQTGYSPQVINPVNFDCISSSVFLIKKV